MNIQDYISSGILEAYMLGDLSEKERTEVEQNLLLYPELRAELQQLEEVQENLLMATAMTPPSRTRQSVLSAVGRREDKKVIPMHRARSVALWRFAAVASVVVALSASLMALYYRGELRKAESDLDRYIAQNQQMAQDYNTVNERLDKVQADVQVMADPAFKQVALKGTENAPGALAVVYWNEDSRELFLSIRNMKALSRQNQYQLWAIIDGKPVDAGVFDTTVAGLVRMKPVVGAAAFAVTIERAGGAAAPSLETMQVIGNVVKG